ncbi:PREDICTED: zinc finger matrin-type protein 5-like [Priapulus caudatus]|uniref:Zinc finger matrin-type protein 5-like n=1 Tax=Priapulus caudatus TaxID=37621 RepID=A0ABM1EMB4_PRICU|nr:PREDICTED: zinc finger matrin-type protein 5-like [Priapulus caudatus]XP_014673334.1 PREDICTED: zinc finger matrin-type protein 5-like [Priapulus caudatus]XP_014673335.1 PREDICTED: zinc finger matrin-type protein 5-like [Priapulus caudatus]
MGKHYYCDYCERSFADNLGHRKRHLKSNIHQQQRQAYYNSLRDASTILREEMGKQSCRKYQQTGECNFKESCRFSHMTPEKLYMLQERVRMDKQMADTRLNQPERDPVDIVNEWLAKRAKGEKPCTSASVTMVTKPKEEEPIHTVPVIFAGHANIPPSVLPPPPGDQINRGSEWG